MNEYLEIVKGTLASISSVDESAIDLSASLVNGLGADSLGIVDLTYSLSKKLSITMPTQSLYEHAEEVLDKYKFQRLFNDGKLIPLASAVTFLAYPNAEVITAASIMIDGGDGCGI